MPAEPRIDFQSLAENSADILCSAGLDRVLNYVSPASFPVLGFRPEEMTGKMLDDFIIPEDLAFVAAAFSSAVESATVRMRRRDGLHAWMEIRARLTPNPAGGEPEAYAIALRDVTERKLLEEKVAAMTLVDGATGLSNRRAFDSALEMEWKRTLRAESPISLLLLEIAAKNEPHDENLRALGDDCVKAVASAVSGAVRGTDFVARYGGSSIAVILPAADTTGAMVAAEKVRAAVGTVGVPEGEREEGGWLIASIGVASALARHGGTMKMPETLLLAADHALQEAKQEGQTCCAWQVDLIHCGGVIWHNAAR